MPALLTLLIVALAAAGVTALAVALVLLRRQGRLDARRGLAIAALLAVTGVAASTGVAALQPAPAVAADPVVVDVQLPTLALDD